MQEEMERKAISVTVQASKLTGKVLRAAIAAVLRKIEKERTTPKVGRNSMKRLAGRDGGSEKITVDGRIRSFERYARKYGVYYHIEKDPLSKPPKWTVYFKANQADALDSALRAYAKRDIKRGEKTSLLSQLAKYKEKSRNMARDQVKKMEHGGPER